MIFYNKKGSPIAYIDDNKRIFQFNGKPLAYIDEKNIFSFNGNHLGFFIDGWILDEGGKKVFFTKNAENARGVMEIYPVFESKQETPEVKSVKEKLEIPDMKEKWSNYSNINFFKR